MILKRNGCAVKSIGDRKLDVTVSEGSPQTDKCGQSVVSDSIINHTGGRMLTVPSVKEVLSGKIALDVECVDRVHLSGYVKYLQMHGGVVDVIREQSGFPFPSPVDAGTYGHCVLQGVVRFAAKQGIEIVTFERGEDKQAIAHTSSGAFRGQSGVVLIGMAQEKALAFKGRRSDKGTKVCLSTAG